MKGIVRVVLACSVLPVVALGQRPTAAPYYPNATTWERRTPEQVGMSSAKIQEAIAFAKEKEVTNPRDLEANHYQTFGREPFGDAIGPIKPRGDMTGVIIKNGYIIAEWGDPTRVDMTHSVTKSFVSTMVGLAMDRGLIRSIDDTVAPYIAPIHYAQAPALVSEGGRGKYDTRTPIDLFSTAHNKKITWKNLLQQNSAWEGTLWGKPDWADRPTGQASTWGSVPPVEPGTAFEYNDVRVNVLSLAVMQLWRRPLPEVAKELVMDPIGASQTWRWYGYDNSWIILDGRMVQAVSGGGHWGGGLFISAFDQARFGLLTMRGGKWAGKQVIPESWIKLSRTPSGPNAGYGFMNFYLNTGKRSMPNAPESTFWHLGNGTNAVICDPDDDLVVVLRWIEGNAMDGVMQRVLAAKTSATP
jgi:CubicO group peptidase (beta-lactamase class C family)